MQKKRHCWKRVTRITFFNSCILIITSQVMNVTFWCLRWKYVMVGWQICSIKPVCKQITILYHICVSAFQVHSFYSYGSKRVDANITKNDGKCHQSYERTTKENKIFLGSMIFKVTRIYVICIHFTFQKLWLKWNIILISWRLSNTTRI